MPGYPHNWAYLGHLTPDLPYLVARGRILGGSTALNGAYFVRATPGDFAAWADAGGADWSYESVLPAMRRLERDPAFADDPRHGDAGPIPIERAPLTDRLSGAFRAAALERGFADEPDKNVPGTPGVGPVPSSLHRGMRWNTGLAYLMPALQRPNLEIRGDARVVRVLIDGGRAVGVELADGERLMAREVVLAAGAIATPQLLMLSGVGPRNQLEALGITVVADLPVGAAFSDHPDIAVGWRPRASVGSPGSGPHSRVPELRLGRRDRRGRSRDPAVRQVPGIPAHRVRASARQWVFRGAAASFAHDPGPRRCLGPTDGVAVGPPR